MSAEDASVKSGLLFAVLTALCWAVLAIAVKVAVNDAASGTIAWIRMFVAFLVLSSLFGLKKPQGLRILKHPPWAAVLAGVFLAGNYFGFIKCVELTTASNTQIMIQMAPMTLVLIGIFYFKETPSIRQAIGIVLAMGGFALFYSDQFNLIVEDKERFIKGNLFVFMGAMTWALFATIQKKLSQKHSPQELNLVIYGTASVVLLPLLEPSDPISWTPGLWVLMIALGLNTNVAYGALGEALKRAKASHVSLILSVNPLLTLLLIHLMDVFHIRWIDPEPVTLTGYLGAAFVVSGVSLTVLKRSSPKPRS